MKHSKLSLGFLILLSGCAYKTLPPGTPIYYTEGGGKEYQELGPVTGKTFGYCLDRRGVHNAAALNALSKSKSIGGNALLLPNSFAGGSQYSTVEKCKWILQIMGLPGVYNGTVTGIAIKE